VAGPRSRAPRLLALSYLGFLSLGLPDGLLGVAWPGIRRSFGLELDAIGALLVATTAGYVASSFASGWILARMGVGALLALSCAGTGLALLGYAAAPAFGALVACGVLAGLGAGAIDAGINTHAAERYPARALGLLHAAYGLGAALGPALLTTLLMGGSPWQRGYAWVAFAQLALAAGFFVTRRLWSPALRGDVAASAERATLPASLREPTARLGIAAFFLYTGLEAAAGAWTFSWLSEARGLGMARAGTGASAFWGGLLAGRLVYGLWPGRIAPHVLVRTCLLGMAVAAVGLWAFAGAVAPLACVALFGLFAGPVFPALVSVTPERLGPRHAANVIGFQIAAAALGQSLLPTAFGHAAERAGLAVLPPLLLGGVALLCAVHERFAGHRFPKGPPLHPTPRPLEDAG
jgi:fucose permease